MTTFATLFSGIEGWGLGAERAGFTQLWGCEIAPFPRKVMAARRPGLRVYDDITRLHATRSHDSLSELDGEAASRLRDGNSEVAGLKRGVRERSGRDTCIDCAPRPDILIASPPCQDLSVAGRRAGLAGARSGLFYDFARLAGELQPSWICMEQVPGLLSSNGGRDFAEVLRTLDELGFGLSWRTLDSRYLGVPQRRRRIYLVGRLGEPCPAEVLFEPEGGIWDLAPRGAAGADVAHALRSSLRGIGNPDGDDFVTETLSSNSRNRSVSPGPIIAAPLTSGGHPNSNAPGRRKEDDENLTTFYSHTGQDQTYYKNEAPPVTSSYPPSVQAASVRRLTPTECERLQGFDDGWTCLCGVTPYDTNTCTCSDGPRYAALGNAITVNAAEWVLRRLAAIAEPLIGEAIA